MPIKPIVNQLESMRNQLVYHTIMGEYKEYVALRKDFAKKCITFPEETEYIPRLKTNFSIFSKFGINFIKTWFKELFRTKTPEEIELNKLMMKIKAKEKSGWIG